MNLPPKFEIGDCVHCFREENIFASGFDFIGRVVKRAQVDDTWEYEVTNAPKLFPGSMYPLLLWESEMTPV
jgi:hypothetical protein